MRVIFPAMLDAFACADDHCPCRASLRAASAGKPDPGASGKFPYREAEQAMLAGSAEIGRNPEAGEGDEPLPERFGDYPIVALRTPAGTELSFSSLCPTVRQILSHNDEPVALARAEGGWRVALRVFQPADGGKEVRLTPRKTVPFAEFAHLRETLMDLVADPVQPLLARLARVAEVVDAAVTDRNLTAVPPPLTARGFLAFRGYVESRTASPEAEPMAAFLADTLALLPDIGVEPADVPAILDALAGDWRVHFRRWLVPAEAAVTPALEAYLGARLFAVPLDRDQSLARGYAELFEAFCVGLRYAAALCEARQLALDPPTALAALALGEHYVASRAEPLPLYERPRDIHDRGPRMADLDMTLESIC